MAAENGHINAMYNLGMLYEIKEGNFSEAYKYYRMAA